MAAGIKHGVGWRVKRNGRFFHIHEISKGIHNATRMPMTHMSVGKILDLESCVL